MADSTGVRGRGVPEPGLRLHRGFYASSAARTVLFYGTVLLVCFVGHVFVAMGVSLFILRFYRREIGCFLRFPARALSGKAPAALEAYRFEIRSPGAFRKG